MPRIRIPLPSPAAGAHAIHIPRSRTAPAAPPHPVRILRPPKLPDAGSRPIRLARAGTGPGAGRSPAHLPRSSRRRSARRWRRHGRKAQVAAVATLFGLLLIVTFIANFLTTQLPNQMQTNDLNHELAVETELGELQALVNAAASSGPSGTSVSQPIQLGSAGVPPFAAPDSGTIGPSSQRGGFQVNFTLAGPEVYSPPTGYVTGCGGVANASFTSCNPGSTGCTATPPADPTSVTCTGATTVNYNFAGGSHSISATGGFSGNLNFSTNYSLISITTTGGATNHITVVGSHDTIFLNDSGGVTSVVTVVGNWDNITFPNTGGATVSVYLVGNHDTITQHSTGGASFTVNVWGSYDSENSATTGGANVVVNFTGFNASGASSPTCPYGNLSSTDTVSETSTGGGSYTANYNTTGYSGTGSAGGFTVHYHKVNGLTCPFFAQYTLPFPIGGTQPGASLAIDLRNSYAPAARVVYDQGAVVYAQTGGVPIMIDAPSFSYAGTSLALTVPVFEGTFPSVTGAGTVDAVLHLLTNTVYEFPGNGLSLKAGSHVTVSIETPYGAAWMNYFRSVSALAGIAQCVGPAGACAGVYQAAGPLADISLALPATSLTLDVALFAVSVE